MKIDETPDMGELCPGAAECVECQCALPCRDSEFGKCATGRFPLTTEDGCFCVTAKCSDESCATETVTIDGTDVCAPNSATLPDCVCRGNACAAPCDTTSCAGGTVCQPATGTCVEDNCRGLGCPAGQDCNMGSGECETNPCAGVICDDGEACREGECEKSCAEVTCEPGQSCSRGECTTNACFEVACDTNQVCNAADGSCVNDKCINVRCVDGSVCDSVSGTCSIDPCRRLECPGGQRCEDGECTLDVKQDGGTGLVDGGGPPDKDGTQDRPDTDKRVLATGGGGCACDVRGGAAPTPGSLLLVMLVLGALVQRRRGAR
jgi:MYXO-CTERM domain-containing protein